MVLNGYFGFAPNRAGCGVATPLSYPGLPCSRWDRLRREHYAFEDRPVRHNAASQVLSTLRNARIYNSDTFDFHMLCAPPTTRSGDSSAKKAHSVPAARVDLLMKTN